LRLDRQTKLLDRTVFSWYGAAFAWCSSKLHRTTALSAKSSQRFLIIAATGLIVILALEMWLSIRHESQTFDESAHMYSGMEYWEHGDFGVNPEHPPLVKLLAALPLLGNGLKLPAPPDLFFRYASGLGGIQFLYANDADKLLFRSRVAASFLTLLLALLIFAAAREMFGGGAGLIALIIFVFEPNILANGALVTTDIGATCGIFAAVYSFYRYAKHRSLPRLMICGLATGFAFGMKHSTLILVPIFLLLAASEIVMPRSASPGNSEHTPIGRRLARWAGAIAVIGAISFVLLWSFYGFRYRARPDSLSINPPLAVYIRGLRNPLEARITVDLSRWHVLPEAYVFGLSDIEIGTQEGRWCYVLGKLYPTGQWFYFPVAFLIKSTLGFLLLLVLLPFAGDLRTQERRRETIYLVLPALVYFIISMTSHLDIGFRHVLPIFPFLIVLAAAGAWSLIRQSRLWAYVVIFLLIFHVASSLHAFPYYLSYSNAAWGGPKNTYKVLTDANVGWTSGLKALHGYIAAHHITDCWFAYSGLAPFAYYQIPCKVLPTFMSENNGSEKGPIPTSIDGTIFIDEMEHAGAWWGPGSLNPYQQFASLHPDNVIAGEILVFHGHFDVPALSALSHLHTADFFARMGKWEQALPELQASLALNPDSVQAHATLGFVLSQLKRKDEAHAEFQKAMDLIHSQYPEFQKADLPEIQEMER
jgi:Dolichyl-phosphate-mannose-protein mannosyltransferase/Tetratricopeptide repeat